MDVPLTDGQSLLFALLVFVPAAFLVLYVVAQTYRNLTRHVEIKVRLPFPSPYWCFLGIPPSVMFGLIRFLLSLLRPCVSMHNFQELALEEDEDSDDEGASAIASAVFFEVEPEIPDEPPHLDDLEMAVLPPREGEGELPLEPDTLPPPQEPSVSGEQSAEIPVSRRMHDEGGHLESPLN